MHVLEGSEHYEALSDAVIEFAKSTGEYDSRLESLTKLYGSVEGMDVNAELVADLVGDYLFTDSKFLESLSAEKPKLFKRLWDEVKYWVKSVTARTPEAKKLLEVEKRFKEAYKDTKKAPESGEVKFSISTDENGNKFVVVSNDSIDKLLSMDGDSLPAKVRNYLKQYRKAVLPLGSTDHAYFRRESENEYTNPAKRLDEETFDSKLKAASEIEDILAASEYLRHENDDGRHADAVRGWNYYQTVFVIPTDNGSKVYSGEIAIKLIQRGDCFYDITKIKDITNGAAGQTYIKAAGSADNVSTDSISQKTDNVNRKNSLSGDGLGDVPIRGDLKISGEEIRLPDDTPIRRDVGTNNAKSETNNAKSETNNAKGGTDNDIAPPIGENVLKYRTEPLSGDDIAPPREKTFEEKVAEVAEAVSKKENTTSRAKTVSNMETVGNESGIDLSDNTDLHKYIAEHSDIKREKAIMQYLVENFAGQTFTLSDGITATMDKTDAKELSHKASDMKVAELSKLREVIEKAKNEGHEVPVNHNKFTHFRYYTIEAKYKGQSIHIQLNVGKEKFSGKYHIYEINRGRANRQNGLSGSVDDRIVNASSNDIIPDAEQNVKGNGENSENAEQNPEIKEARTYADVNKKLHGMNFIIFSKIK